MLRACGIAVDRHGPPGRRCAFLDAEGQTRVLVGISWNEMPQIQLTAPDGTARVALVVRPEGMGMVVLADQQQRSKMITPTDT